MKLAELIKETEALTYANALKVTLTEIKDEISSIEEMVNYIDQSAVRVRKLVRRADNNYRLLAKAASQNDPGFAANVSIEENVNEEAKKLMEGE